MLAKGADSIATSEGKSIGDSRSEVDPQKSRSHATICFRHLPAMVYRQQPRVHTPSLNVEL